MWKSNATRVRSISSRLSTQHASGVEKRWYSSGKLEGDALPITNEEFRSAFEEVVNSQAWKKHTRIGKSTLVTMYRVMVPVKLTCT